MPSNRTTFLAQSPFAAPPMDGANEARAEHSRFVQRVRRRHEAGTLALLPEGAPNHVNIDALIQTFLDRGASLSSALRWTRALVVERLTVLDVEQDAPLDTVIHGITAMAEVALERALAGARAELNLRHGEPLNDQGHSIEFWIIGMGKLGGRELNVSSDIDLIYVYEEEGQTTGRADGVGVISAHEYFAHLAKSLYALIGDTTEDGFVFRVDLALRPHGQSGPTAVSLAMLEEYLLVNGREWERFAWLKSRIVAPRAAVDSDRGLALRDVVVPFVFRRYLDYGIFESLRQLHSKVRDEAQRRAAGRPERANDVKLSRGGIREIEFIVQLLQVVRGGQFPELRTRSTLRALQQLAARGLMGPEVSERLAQAYVFLRRVEHRIQYLDDQQTHIVPSDDADLNWLARSMRLTCSADACELLDRLGEHREFVAQEFDALLHDGQADRPNTSPPGEPCRQCGNKVWPVDTQAFIDTLSPHWQERVQQFAAHPRVSNLKEEAKIRLARLLTRADQHCKQSPDAANRFIDWIEPLMRRDSYLAMLSERPDVLSRLLRLLGLAKWPSRYLMQHPGVIDELADTRLLSERFDRSDYLSDLERRHEAWSRGGQADEESLLDTLRRAHHAEVFRTLVRDLEGVQTVEAVADDLSALADATLDCAMRWSWQHLRKRHCEQPALAIIAYGKLGGKELGYGSDLDIVFLYDDPHEDAAEIYATYARKLITWLTLRTSAGEMFDIDTALRPNGNSGLLVTTTEAFKRYQTQRGSNTAWTWEHQAITRARWCAGDPSLAESFNQTRCAVLSAKRDAAALVAEIIAMRDKVRTAHAVPANTFDVKHSHGGMMDVEFVVQYLVLAHSATVPELLSNLGNIALLQKAEAGALLPPGLGQACADAYRAMRQVQHRARLDEAPTTVPLAAMGDLVQHRAAVMQLWQCVTLQAHVPGDTAA